MTNALIVYYSNTGHTRKVAEELAEVSRWSIAEIRDAKPRKGRWGEIRCAIESLTGIKPRIEFTSSSFDTFDVVIIGTPVWAGHVASPVQSFLAKHRDDLSRVAFFCTCAGPNSSPVFDQLHALTGKVPVNTLAITNEEMKSSNYRDKLAAFAKAV
jgi:menaquinone-dependent protoporphyrinogen IX oxidase